uniref:GIY-YIG domain-containing protein n=1 Tax=Trichobilharzia regenti TaxID=157069 RepID=A0AA85KGJ3_TRIRE|nr:unnamed protein product [Trichobilharzia regenti]
MVIRKTLSLVTVKKDHLLTTQLLYQRKLSLLTYHSRVTRLFSSKTAQRLRSAVKRIFCAASSLFLTCRTFSIPAPTIKGPNSMKSTSNCIYKFTCSCGDTYIGRTNKMFQCRRKEHVPKWLLNHIENPNVINLNRNPASSSIAKHLLMSGHKININDCFTIILSHTSNSRLVIKDDDEIALDLSHVNPKLCVQKAVDFNLRLP